MSAKLKELREKRAEVYQAMDGLRSKVGTPEWTKEVEAKWDELNSRYDSICKDMQRIERMDELDREQNERSDDVERESRRGGESRGNAPATIEDRNLAMQAWARRQSKRDVTPEHEEAARRCGVDINARELALTLDSGLDHQRRMYASGLYRSWTPEARALSVGTDSAGGYTVPEGFSGAWERSMLAYGGVRRVARIMRTAAGEDIPWPTVNDTGNEGAILAENTQDSEQDIVTGVITFKAWKFTSKIVRVSAELLQDSAFNMATELGSMLSERIARAENNQFTLGDGTTEPQGFTVGAGTGVTAAATGAITGDEIYDLVHSVDPAYRISQSAAFMMHDSIIKEVRQLKDGQGNFLWTDDFTRATPGTLAGFPIVTNQHMASSLAASAIVATFGDWSKYIVRDVGEVRMKRLVERYADYDQEAFVAFKRSDGRILDAGTDPLKNLVMAAS